jgi:hypothetical protein
MGERESNRTPATRPGWLTWKLGCVFLAAPPLLLLVFVAGLVLFGDSYPTDREWFPAALHHMGDHGP